MPKAKVGNLDLHKEVVTGIVQILRYVDRTIKGKGHPDFGKAWKIGIKGKSGRAQMFIGEFVKDGIVGLKQETVDKAIAGDYAWIWEMTNDFLEHFGHPSVEPTPTTI